jgi:hypothetical protein
MTVEKGSTPESPPVEVSATPATTPAVAVSSTDVTPEAAPSTAKDESLLDRVKSALEPKTAGSSPAPASQEASPNPDAPSEDDEKEPESDPTEEEQARYHSKTRKQIRRLLGQRNEALDQVKELQPEAEGFRKITGYIRDSGMTPDEANLLLEVGRNMKQDPLKALEQLKPYYDALQRMAGDVLPPDLQAAVDRQEITPVYARQLARTKTETAVLSQRTQAQEDALQRREVENKTQRLGDEISGVISTWERNQAQTDPDWNLKQSRIAEMVELEVLRTGRPPRDSKEAIDLAEKARTAVNAELARYAPRRQAVTPVNPASAARVAPAKPTSALEAARMALQPTG